MDSHHSSDLTAQKLSLDEERRRYADLNGDMADGKNRILALLSVEFVLMAYLFSDISSVLPAELYGIIFFSVGVACIILSIGLLLFNIRAVEWPDPIGDAEIIKIESSDCEVAQLKVAVSDYRAANKCANGILAVRAKCLNWSLYLFVMGVIILLILRFF